jgi:hypothetical protein
VLTREQRLRYLGQISDELKARDVHGEIILTGGAAMRLVHVSQDMTKDIDALYEPKDDINFIVRNIAYDEELPEDWLNDSVKGFIEPNAQIEDLISLSNLRVLTVSTAYLLAMKMMSSRFGEKDKEDIQVLVKKLGIRTADEAIDNLLKFYPAKRIMPRTQYLIEEIMEEFCPPDA